MILKENARAATGAGSRGVIAMLLSSALAGGQRPGYRRRRRRFVGDVQCIAAEASRSTASLMRSGRSFIGARSDSPNSPNSPTSLNSRFKLVQIVPMTAPPRSRSSGCFATIRMTTPCFATINSAFIADQSAPARHRVAREAAAPLVAELCGPLRQRFAADTPTHPDRSSGRTGTRQTRVPP